MKTVPTYATSLKSFPTPFIRALTKSNYNKGHSLFSATQLISPPQRTWLGKNHEKQENPYTMFHALMGTAIHSILEDNVDIENGEVAEERLHFNYTPNPAPNLDPIWITEQGEIINIPISGQIDFYEDHTIFDYKNTAGFQDKIKEEHFKQVQINGWLAKQNGYEVEHVAVVYLQRDWSYMRSVVDPTYPQSPFQIYVAPFDENYAKALIDMKVHEHWQAWNGNPRPCTSEEQWERPSTYAVMSPGAKRASRLCDTYEEAMEIKKPNQTIEIRKGEKTFCRSFCGYSHCCRQFQIESQKLDGQPCMD
jgi:hypothetical protein